jgi:hypothetical protein
MPSAFARSLWIALLLSTTGCAWLFTPIQDEKGHILQPTLMDPGSVAIEVISLRLPAGDPQLVQKIWQEVDEQSLPVEVRRKLEKDGFRAGVLAGQIPPSLSKLLELKPAAAGSGDVQQVKIADFVKPARVTSQHLQTRAGQRYEIAASGVLEKMPVLVSESGEIHGLTYERAQGIFAVRVTPQLDGRVEVELSPEVHHGKTRQHWVGDQSIFRLETGRPKRAFEELKLSAMLGPGGILILGSQPDRQGSLGHYFFLENNGRDDRLDEKLILVRLSQTQHNDFIAPRPLPWK